MCRSVVGGDGRILPRAAKQAVTPAGLNDSGEAYLPHRFLSRRILPALEEMAALTRSVCGVEEWLTTHKLSGAMVAGMALTRLRKRFSSVCGERSSRIYSKVMETGDIKVGNAQQQKTMDKPLYVTRSVCVRGCVRVRA